MPIMTRYELRVENEEEKLERDGRERLTHENNIEALRAIFKCLQHKQAVHTHFEIPVVLFHVGQEQHHIHWVILHKIVRLYTILERKSYWEYMKALPP